MGLGLGLVLGLVLGLWLGVGFGVPPSGLLSFLRSEEEGCDRMTTLGLGSGLGLGVRG